MRSFPCFKPVCDELRKSVTLPTKLHFNGSSRYLIYPWSCNRRLKLALLSWLFHPLFPHCHEKQQREKITQSSGKIDAIVMARKASNSVAPVTLFVTTWRIRNLSIKGIHGKFFSVFCINLKKSVNWEPKTWVVPHVFGGMTLKSKIPEDAV